MGCIELTRIRSSRDVRDVHSLACQRLFFMGITEFYLVSDGYAFRPVFFLFIGITELYRVSDGFRRV